MAEHALRRDRAAEVTLALPVIARTHGPGTAIFRIPAHRQLDQLPVRGAMQIAARVVPRPDDVVHPLFHHTGLFAVEACLPTPLKELAVAFEHGVVQTGRRMEEGVRVRVVFHGAGRGGPEE